MINKLFKHERWNGFEYSESKFILFRCIPINNIIDVWVEQFLNDTSGSQCKSLVILKLQKLYNF